ncbi:MAG: hypothetical protein RIQ52_571 [Pseudomonadota bacterium]|jgi:endonuclease YncB( thermonuclease family)
MLVLSVKNWTGWIMRFAFNRCYLQSWLAILLLLSGAVQAAPEILTGKVVSVHDGDTITLLIEGKKTFRIRLAQIDAPETGQAYGERSRDNLAGKVAGQSLRVEVSATDRYGRTVGTLFLGQRDINREQLADGMAWVYRQYLKDKSLLEIERSARERGLGLWADPHPIPPWEFRHGPSAGHKASEEAIPAGHEHDGNCGSKRFCREMVSCAEAQFYLKQCGLERLDGDGNGIACEKLCADEKQQH